MFHIMDILPLGNGYSRYYFPEGEERVTKAGDRGDNTHCPAAAWSNVTKLSSSSFRAFRLSDLEEAGISLFNRRGSVKKRMYQVKQQINALKAIS
jgi:hypothetical protein